MTDSHLSLPYPSLMMRWLLRVPSWLYTLGFGEPLNHLNIMMLTTRGRKTHLPRHTAIEYRRHGSKIYVISAWGERPSWVKDLQTTPHAALRLGSKRITVKATPVDNDGEALRVIHLFRRTAPFYYDSLLAWMSEEISVNQHTLPDISGRVTIMRLEPTTEPADIPFHEAWLGWLLPSLTVFSAITLLIVGVTRGRR